MEELIKLPNELEAKVFELVRQINENEARAYWISLYKYWINGLKDVWYPGKLEPIIPCKLDPIIRSHLIVYNQLNWVFFYNNKK